MSKSAKKEKGGLKRRPPKRVLRTFSVNVVLNSRLVSDENRVREEIPKNWTYKGRDETPISRRIVLEYTIDVLGE